MVGRIYLTLRVCTGALVPTVVLRCPASFRRCGDGLHVGHKCGKHWSTSSELHDIKCLKLPICRSNASAGCFRHCRHRQFIDASKAMSLEATKSSSTMNIQHPAVTLIESSCSTHLASDTILITQFHQRLTIIP